MVNAWTHRKLYMCMSFINQIITDHYFTTAGEPLFPSGHNVSKMKALTLNSRAEHLREDCIRALQRNRTEREREREERREICFKELTLTIVDCQVWSLQSGTDAMVEVVVLFPKAGNSGTFVCCPPEAKLLLLGTSVQILLKLGWDYISINSP